MKYSNKIITITVLIVFVFSLNAFARWLSVDPKADKYPSVSPYVYAMNNPMTNVDPDGQEVVKLVVNVESARAQIHSDKNPTRDVPVAVTDFSRNSGPTPGTTLPVRGTAWGPVSNQWQGAQTSWQQNKGNPFGPAIIILQDAQGNKSQDHLHGTNGPMDGGIQYIGGTNPENRKFTHGCTRFTNQTITEIVTEGVKEGAPVEFIDNQSNQPKEDKQKKPEDPEQE